VRGRINLSSVEPIVIQRLLDEVERLERELRQSGDMKTLKINEKGIHEARAAIVDGNAFDPVRWSQLSVDKQKVLLDRLMRVRDGLLAKNSAEDAKHLNYLLQGEGGLKQPLIWLAIFGFIFAATLLSLIR